MRFDQLITTGLVDPAFRLFRRKPSPSQRILPILMYHSISDDPESGKHPYFKVCTSPEQFARQLQWLAELGYRGVTLREGLAWLNAKPQTTTPMQPVAITFDDGFRDFHTAAFPALLRHGFTATMYLPTGYVNNERKSFNSRECLTWDEARELQQAGIEFGSHTVNHPRLVQLSWAEIERELHDSHDALEKNLGVQAPAFAYPYGFPQAEATFVKGLQTRLRQSGYETCVTTTIGRARPDSNPMNLRRLPANSADTRSLFEAKLRGSYDWLSSSQYLTKQAARAFRPGRRPVAICN